jgi:hypothetical protein
MIVLELGAQRHTHLSQIVVIKHHQKVGLPEHCAMESCFIRSQITHCLRCQIYYDSCDNQI